VKQDDQKPERGAKQSGNISRQSTDMLSVAICICTYRRPEMLRGLLDRLRAEAENITAKASVGVVVVDDDPDGSAESVAKSAGLGFGLGVEYIHAGSRNIAIARNLAINAGIETASLIALIDDDCVPAEGWLSELLKVFSIGEAEIVTGVCVDEFPETYPSWVHRGPYFDQPMVEPDGSLVATGYIKNILIDADALRRSRIQFDPVFGQTGGEDEMFLIQTRRLGFRNRRAAGAVVYEKVPANRLNFKYQLRRRFWYGNTESLTNVASGDASRWRVFGRGIRMIARSLPMVPMRLLRRQPAELHSAAALLLQGMGRVLGAAGISVNHR